MPREEAMSWEDAESHAWDAMREERYAGRVRPTAEGLAHSIAGSRVAWMFTLVALLRAWRDTDRAA